MYGQKIEIPDRCDNGEGSYLFQHEPTSDLSLAPSSTVVSFDEITIYRIGGGEGSSIILVYSELFLSLKPRQIVFWLGLCARRLRIPAWPAGLSSLGVQSPFT